MLSWLQTDCFGICCALVLFTCTSQKFLLHFCRVHAVFLEEGLWAKLGTQSSKLRPPYFFPILKMNIKSNPPPKISSAEDSVRVHAHSLYRLNRLEFTQKSSSWRASKISLRMFSFYNSSVCWFVLSTLSLNPFSRVKWLQSMNRGHLVRPKFK
jgi:hypothetical protein